MEDDRLNQDELNQGEDMAQFMKDTFPELVAEQQADLKPCPPDIADVVLRVLQIGPPDIADVVLRVLQIGLLEARAAGWSGDAERGMAQADHLHNLPDLLRLYSPRKLKHYWERERPLFISRMGGQPIAFEEIWAELKPLVTALSDSTVSQGL